MRTFIRFAPLLCAVAFCAACASARTPAAGGLPRTSSVVALPSGIGQANPIVALPGEAAILDAFLTHPIVLFGESHRSAETHAFLRALVSAPAFAERVNDIVIESGNTRYQGVLDRYVRGDSVPTDSLRLVWRNTTQLLAWDSPLYQQFIETVRDVNFKLPPTKQLRVLAGDPPIDWGRVASSVDFPKSYGYRDWQTTEIIEREVLARNRRALVVIGSTHITHHEPRPDTILPSAEKLGLGEALEHSHPGLAYSVYTLVGDEHPELESLISAIGWPTTLIPVRATQLGTLSSRLLYGGMTFFGPGGVRRSVVFPSMGDVVDAVLYLGPFDNKILADRSVYIKDPAYVAEIRRRISILAKVYGGDFWSDELDEATRR